MSPDESDLGCPVCRAAQPRRLYRLTRFSIYACRECSQVYLRPLPSPEAIRELFSRLYSGEGSDLPELAGYYDYCFEDSPDNPLVQQYEIWLDAIERHRKPGRILDIGCGTGLFLAVARRRGWEPFGIDDCAEATDHAREHFGLDVWIGEFEAFADEGHRFDVITGWDVIEHTRDPVGLARVMRTCLAAGGAVALSTPNQRSTLDLVAGALYRASGGLATRALEKFYIDQHFLYFTPATLSATLERAGLKVEELRLERTDLRRLSLGPATRFALESLFLFGHWIGRDNRIFALASSGR